MDISPRTDREKLIAEIAHAQGFQEGAKAFSEGVVQRGLKALIAIESVVSSIQDQSLSQQNNTPELSAKSAN